MKSLNTQQLPLITGTYRLQFHAGFRFKDLLSRLDYLEKLGVSTIYASPILKAIPGSTHGYDVADFSELNDEIGSVEELKEIAAQLKKRNMNWIQDIVPNHMSYHMSNPYIYDVLERGQLSTYADFFDILWDHPDPELNGKLMAPFLDQPLEECLQQFKLDLSDEGLIIRYNEQQYPLSLCAYPFLSTLAEKTKEFEILKEIFSDLYQYTNKQPSLQEWQHHKKQWLDEVQSFNRMSQKIKSFFEQLNADSKNLEKIIRSQCYCLCHWTSTEKKINYRRFFTVNDLICLKMEEEKVFNEYHRFIHHLFSEGLIQGFRIDHIDGLLDPEDYLCKFRHLFGDSCYVLVEKILEAGEKAPSAWEIQGTTGYDFLHHVNQLLTKREGADRLKDFYKEILPQFSSYENIVFQSKQLILEQHMQGEWENLMVLAKTSGLWQGDLNREQLKKTIALFLISLPVYRVYPPIKNDPESITLIQKTLLRVRNLKPDAAKEISWLEDLWVTDKEEHDIHRIHFLRKLMQTASPLMAKGVEDTTFYRYNVLLSHNEVGDTPALKGISIRNFHKQMQERQLYYPLTMNTTTTHDTKRGEDARARINTLSFFPDEWKEVVTYWIMLNNHLVQHTDHIRIPTLNDEYFIYQSLVAGFEQHQDTENFAERFTAYLMKSISESKTFITSHETDEQYKTGVTSFIQHLLLHHPAFHESLQRFLHQIDKYSYYLSVSQTAIKLTAPGIPDIYQGAELNDYSYVDPDNRRAVDFEIRQTLLTQALTGKETAGNRLLHKILFTSKILQLRKKYPSVFLEGAYVPLETPDSNAVIAFARTDQMKWIITIAATPDLISNGTDKRSASIALPASFPRNWVNEITGEKIAGENRLQADMLLHPYPVAILSSE